MLLKEIERIAKGYFCKFCGSYRMYFIDSNTTMSITRKQVTSFDTIFFTSNVRFVT